MRIDKYNRIIYTEDDLIELLYDDPEISLDNVICDNPQQFNASSKELIYPWNLIDPTMVKLTESEYHKLCQSEWYMPNDYKRFDVAKWLLEQCENDEQLQRVGKELLMYAERDMLDMLKFLKYLVDTMRANNIVWGVGRGSSVSSYVLFLLGVHKIDSIYYGLDIEEFLR